MLENPVLPCRLSLDHEWNIIPSRNFRLFDDLIILYRLVSRSQWISTSKRDGKPRTSHLPCRNRFLLNRCHQLDETKHRVILSGHTDCSHHLNHMAFESEWAKPQLKYQTRQKMWKYLPTFYCKLWVEDFWEPTDDGYLSSIYTNLCIFRNYRLSLLLHHITSSLSLI